jgi:hypothetical protein
VLAVLQTRRNGDGDRIGQELIGQGLRLAPPELRVANHEEDDRKRHAEVRCPEDQAQRIGLGGDGAADNRVDQDQGEQHDQIEDEPHRRATRA